MLLTHAWQLTRLSHRMNIATLGALIPKRNHRASEHGRVFGIRPALLVQPRRRVRNESALPLRTRALTPHGIDHLRGKCFVGLQATPDFLSGAAGLFERIFGPKRQKTLKHSPPGRGVRGVLVLNLLLNSIVQALLN